MHEQELLENNAAIAPSPIDDLPPEPPGGRPYTPAQRAAMCIRGRTVLVSAAAGSGKTAVLTERIVRMLKGDAEHPPMSISDMLIVTFTKAAAGELKARITAALSDAVAKNPGDLHLCRQLLLLGSANISTIDSFFEEPVRAHFAELGLSSAMRHADDAELAPLYTDVMNRTLDRMYEAAADAVRSDNREPSFLHLVDAVLPVRDASDQTLPFLSLYKKLITMPEGVDALLGYADKMARDAEGDFADSLIGKRLLAGAVSEISLLCRRTERAIEEMETDPVLSVSYLPAFEEDRAAYLRLVRLLQNGTYAEIAEAMHAFTFPALKPVKKDAVAPRKDYMLALRKKNRERFKKLTERLFAYDLDALSAQLRESADTALALHRLLSAFDTALSDEKKTRGICDFPDMPRYLLRLLQAADGTPTPLAAQMCEEYAAVFIDEYQDVNRLQDRIFTLIGGNHRFMVGDIKQSIYGFREADPSIFASLRAALPPAQGPATASPDGCSVFMSENFRCDPNVIRFVNLVCGYTFAACPDTIGYKPEDDLVCGKKMPSDDYVSPPVTLLLTERPDTPPDGASPYLSPNDAEAELVARRICRLIGHKRLANGALVTPGDIAVLVQAQSHADKLVKLLTARGIPVSCPSYSNLLHSADTKLLLALLEVLNNPRTDLPLSELLTAPAFGICFSLEELVSLRADAGTALSLYDALLFCVKEHADTPLAKKCDTFCRWLDKRRADTVRLSADRLLRTLADDPILQGLTATDAFTLVYDSARNYVRRAWNGLYGFLHYFRRVCETDGASGGAPEAVLSNGAVSVMTIHKAKGLEFPICFVYGCGNRFNLRDSTSSILFSRSIGVAVRSYDSETLTRRNTAVRSVIADDIRDGLVEERMRLLYVALTRAREYLYISGAVDSVEKQKEAALDASLGDRSLTLSAQCFLDWIFSALALSPDALGECGFVREEIGRNLPLEASAQTDAPIRLPEAPKETEAASAAPSYDYAALAAEAPILCANSRLLAAVPAKAAASLVSENMLDHCVFFPNTQNGTNPIDSKDESDFDLETAQTIRKRLELMRSQKEDFSHLLSKRQKPTAVDLGNAAHRFLQFCDYARVEADGVEAEVQRLLADGFIDAHTARILNRRQMAQFFAGSLYQKIKSAKTVRREVRFTSFLPLRQFTENPALQVLVGDRTLYVQGSIDLLLEFDDGSLYLCDYKTDAVSPEERENPALLSAHMSEKHGGQLRQYADAVRRIYGNRPLSVAIYSLAVGQEITGLL